MQESGTARQIDRQKIISEGLGNLIRFLYYAVMGITAVLSVLVIGIAFVTSAPNDTLAVLCIAGSMIWTLIYRLLVMRPQAE